MKKLAVISILGVLLLHNTSTLAYQAPKALVAPVIDGNADDAAWANAPWQAIDQLILGTQPSPEDFTGRFKLVWTASKLYLLGEIVDDVLIDTHADPLDQYWEDDTFEIFIDEDRSGGDHLESHNAFAYHISIDNQAVDYSSYGKPEYYTHHVQSKWQRDSQNPNAIIWEVSFDIYPDTYRDDNLDGKHAAKPVVLKAGKKMGFMAAYCDSDNAVDGRQHFMSSFDIPAVDGDKNRGYKDASVFEHLTLVEE